MPTEPRIPNGAKRVATIAGGAGAILTALVAMVVAVWSASADRAAAAAQAATNTVAIIDQETRLRAVETQLSQVAADVRWIRAAMERREKRP